MEQLLNEIDRLGVGILAFNSETAFDKKGRYYVTLKTMRGSDKIEMEGRGHTFQEALENAWAKFVPFLGVPGVNGMLSRPAIEASPEF